MKKIFTGQEKGVIQFLLGIFVIGLAVGAYRDRNEENVSQDTIEEMEAFTRTSEIVALSTKFKESAPKMKQVGGNTHLTVNINSAEKSELMKLPKIGPVTAERIIRFREDFGLYNAIEDLSKVKGIGSKTLELIRPFVELK